MKKLRLALILFLSAAFFQAAVVNPDRPRKGDWDFRLEKVWEIDKAGDDLLGRPFSLTATEDGFLYVFDTAHRTNFVFDKDGKFVRAFARSGQGPGEVQGQELIHYVNGKVYIPAPNGIHVYTKDGVYIQTLRPEGALDNVRAFVNENEIISAPMTAVFLPDGKGQIIRKNIKTGEEKVVSGFSLQDWGMAQSGENVVDIVAVGFSPLMIVGYAENRLYWGMNTSYMINVTDLGGKKVNTFSVKRESKKVSDKFKREYFKNPNLPEEMLNQIVAGLPNEISFFHRIEVHGGLVYVFVPDVDLETRMARLKQLDIFSPEGEYLYRARIEFEKDRRPLFSPLNNLVIQNGHLYAVLTDDEENVHIAKYRIALPKGN